MSNGAVCSIQFLFCKQTRLVLTCHQNQTLDIHYINILTFCKSVNHQRMSLFKRNANIYIYNPRFLFQLYHIVQLRVYNSIMGTKAHKTGTTTVWGINRYALLKIVKFWPCSRGAAAP